MGGGASKNSKAFKKTEVERYISLGRTSIIRNQKRASDGLERISRTGGEEATNAIVEMGGMQVITTQLANSKSSNVRLKSAMILANVSKYDKIRPQLFDERVCLCLVDLIGHGKPAAMRPYCIEGIANMAILAEARPDLLAATPNILKFIAGGNLSEQLAGLNALRRVAGHTKCHFKMVSSGTVTAVETILLSQFHTNQHKCFAAQVPTACAQPPFLRQTPDAPTARPAPQTLAELCRTPVCHGAVLDCNKGQVLAPALPLR
jgi:hypothetical protein